MAEKKRWLDKLTPQLTVGEKSFNTTQRRVEQALEKTTSAISHTGSLNDRTYAQMYRTQPAVRTVVDFIARNVAQLSIKHYSRVSDTERKHLSGSVVETLLEKPNPYSTRYRMTRDTIADRLIFDDAFWVKVRLSNGSLGLLRIPATMVAVGGQNMLAPSWYVVSPYGSMASSGQPVALEDMIHFRGYDPEDGRTGYSPMETLRRILEQDIASDEHMTGYWKHAPRNEGIIKRPLEAGEWSDEAAERFRQDLVNHYSGAANAGRPLILEEGMEWQSDSFDPKSLAYQGGKKLTLETVCQAFHVPISMLMPQSSDWGVDKYHEMLYADTLAPMLVEYQEDLELQLLPEFPNTAGTYLEFNLDAKMAGSFEQRHTALLGAVGGAYMTANEARAILNLPPIDGGDELRTTPGSEPAAGGEEPVAIPEAATASAPELIQVKAAPVSPAEIADYTATFEGKMRQFFERQRSAQLGKADWDAERWDRELTDDLFEMSYPMVRAAGSAAAIRLGKDGAFNVEETLQYLSETSRIRAENINRITRRGFDTPDADQKQVFDDLLGLRLPILASMAAVALANFSTHEAARQGGAGKKTWNVNNPKSRHPHLGGETVEMDGRFSNGAKWPGDPILSADETARCQCTLSFEGV